MKTFYLLLVFLLCCLGSGVAGWYFGKESSIKDQQMNLLGGRVMQLSKEMGDMQKIIEMMAMHAMQQQQQQGGKFQIK